jgi:hypothetical protein
VARFRTCADDTRSSGTPTRSHAATMVCQDITAGCVNTVHEGTGDTARWAALAAGFPDSVPAVAVNRFCASSLTGAISSGHRTPVRICVGSGQGVALVLENSRLSR